MEGLFVDGVFKGARKIFHLISGSNVTITADDSPDAGDNEIEITIDASGGSGAPTDVDYLVGTADGDLSNEIVVGTTPGGELGGTWASPTVDATHSGSTHSTATDAHIADVTDVHDHGSLAGLTDDDHTQYLKESVLSEANAVDLTDGGETALHSHAGAGVTVELQEEGVAVLDASAINFDGDDFDITDETGGVGGVNVAATHAGSTHSAATDTHIADAADAHDASAISIADAGNDFTATDVEGALDELQADNEAHVAAADPHTGYRLESADHTHQSTGAQAGQLTVAALSDAPAGELGGTWASPTVDATHSGSTHSAATDTHIADAADAHDASAISADSTTLVGTGTDVQAVLEELDNGIADHLADAADAHDASAISIVDAGGDFTATDVEGALDELQADNEAHVAAADPHTGYVLESLFDAAGDLITASADNTPSKLTRGADDTFLRATGSTIAYEAIPFSISVFLDGAGSTLATGRRPIWNAAFPCTVTAVKAYVDTGTTTVVNAGTTATAGAEEFCSADITIDPADAWESGTVNQNQAITVGETVGVEVITAGTATQITIQIDLTRP